MKIFENIKYHLKNDDNKNIKTYTMALVGNPNVGKTTLFNYLTNSKEKVGNWPGVTIKKKCGYFYISKSENIKIFDLPGIYSISPNSSEEEVTKKFLINEKPNLLINIIDALNLERNLYLTFELKKLGIPMIIFLNMMEEVKKKGDTIDLKKLKNELDIPIFVLPPLNIINMYRLSNNPTKNIKNYLKSDYIRNYIKIKTDKKLNNNFILKEEDIYSKISKIISKCYYTNINHEVKLTEKIDNFLTHKYIGLPLFLFFTIFIFKISFGSLGLYFTNKIILFFIDILPKIIENLFITTNIPYWLTSLLINGIISGVGSILSFLPQMIIIFLFLTLMEDSGYMSRVVFLTDRLLQFIGLSGKSFISIIMGLGCSVPAIMTTRTINNSSVRKKTILITPLISCGARLPIYILFTNIFFSEHSHFVLFSIYLLSIGFALLSSLFFKLILKETNDEKPFIIEFPPYRIPNIFILFSHIWDNIKEYITKAGTSIFIMSIFIWFLQSFDFTFSLVEDNNHSIFGYVG